MRRNLTRRLLAVGVAVAALAFVSPAVASQVLGFGATGATLSVDAKGEALITFTQGGTLRRVLAWGAINARAPASTVTQVAFSLDYSGGYGKYHTDYWKTFHNLCQPYDGPALAWEVAACKAPDGSYWALQAWPRSLPDYGVTPSGSQGELELHLAHWSGAEPVLSVTIAHLRGRHDEIFGSYTLDGSGIYGFKSSRSGVPLDSFGRNIYLDTYDSAYGADWKRENSFLTHAPNGSFCYRIARHGSHPPGEGTMYRAVVMGPGVEPDVAWSGSPGAYLTGPARAALIAQLRALGDRHCTSA